MNEDFEADVAAWEVENQKLLARQAGEIAARDQAVATSADSEWETVEGER